ncbi:MAG TPA: hypothetical protein VFO49_20915 [Nocardioides sp.]|nr:hypothetical protein [Nocardioides sp.]
MTVGIVEPVPDALHRLLRRAVLDLAEGERRRQFPPTLHAGTPGGSEAVFEPDRAEPEDAALRVDVVEALVRRVHRGPDPPLVWLARPGPLDTQDLDLHWLAAASAAAGELGVGLRMVVINRRSWRDPCTGVGREWQRLRRRS